jgi:hypothetical protein
VWWHKLSDAKLGKDQSLPFPLLPTFVVDSFAGFRSDSLGGLPTVETKQPETYSPIGLLPCRIETAREFISQRCSPSRCTSLGHVNTAAIPTNLDRPSMNQKVKRFDWRLERQDPLRLTACIPGCLIRSGLHRLFLLDPRRRHHALLGTPSIVTFFPSSCHSTNLFSC